MKIAVVPGDGIGKEVISAVLPVLRLLNECFSLEIDYDLFDWGAERWLADGVGLPDGAISNLTSDYRAMLFGALGDPRIPDMAHGRDILLGLRRGLDLYVNYRPVHLPDTGHRIDIYRENTQGLYQGIGGTVSRGNEVEVAIDECVYTREKVDRFIRYCLTDIRRRGRRKVTLVHKANAIPNTGRLWQSIFWDALRDFPELTGVEEYVDAFCYHFVRSPMSHEAVVASNLFGDIISDIGAALMGGLGLAPSASICPESGFGLFEPVHGSAPDIAGKGIADPRAALYSMTLMLEHLGMEAPAGALKTCLRAEPFSVGEGAVGTTQAFVEKLLRALNSDIYRQPATSCME